MIAAGANHIRMEFTYASVGCNARKVSLRDI